MTEILKLRKGVIIWVEKGSGFERHSQYCTKCFSIIESLFWNHHDHVNIQLNYEFYIVLVCTMYIWVKAIYNLSSTSPQPHTFNSPFNKLLFEAKLTNHLATIAWYIWHNIVIHKGFSMFKVSGYFSNIVNKKKYFKWVMTKAISKKTLWV